MSGVTSPSTVGIEHAVFADLAAGEDLGAAGDRFVDPRLHAVALAGRRSAPTRRCVSSSGSPTTSPSTERHERVEEALAHVSCT